MSPGFHCWRVLAPVGLCPPHRQGHSPHRRGQSAPPLRAGRRQRLPGPQHRQRCSLLSPTFPGESPKPRCLAQTGSYGGGRRVRTPRRAPPGRPPVQGSAGAGGPGPACHLQNSPPPRASFARALQREPPPLSPTAPRLGLPAAPTSRPGAAPPPVRLARTC